VKQTVQSMTPLLGLDNEVVLSAFVPASGHLLHKVPPLCSSCTSPGAKQIASTENETR